MSLSDYQIHTFENILAGSDGLPVTHVTKKLICLS